jgi:hypothetical protein
MPLQTTSSRVLAPRTAVVVLLVLAYAAFAATLDPNTWPSAIAVVVPAAVLGVVALRRHRPSTHAWSPLMRRSVKIWAVLIVIGLLWEAWAFFHQPAWDVASFDHPTLSTLVTPALDEHVVRFAAWALWLYAGLRLVRTVWDDHAGQDERVADERKAPR